MYHHSAETKNIGGGVSLSESCKLRLQVSLQIHDTFCKKISRIFGASFCKTTARELTSKYAGFFHS